MIILINGTILINLNEKYTRKFIFEVRNFPKSDAGDRYLIITQNAIETFEAIEKLNPNGEYLFEKNGKRLRALTLS